MAALVAGEEASTPLISFEQFLGVLSSNPFLIIVMVLVMGTIFVNGATDAANAIAEPVGTRSIDVDSAIFMSVICNFVGLVAMSFISTAVADTISGMVDFGGDSHAALIALAAATVGIVAWGLGAWAFGIPTSESHALIAGLTGAALAVSGGLDGVNGAEWIKVVYGLALSTVLGFLAGWAISKIIPIACKNADRRTANNFFGRMQVLGAAGVALMHGAQDGQKFIGVLFLGMAFCNGQSSVAGVVIPVWLMLLCSVIMGLGTSVGGERIIKSVGQDMVKLEKFQGFSADLSSALCLLLMTVLGIPVSTTHTKTSAIMGVGAVKRLSAINFGVVKDMMLTWVFTFPGCGIISYIMAKLFMFIF